jgi:colanic acid/amylovoran biosynthesis glycosyltransferase
VPIFYSILLLFIIIRPTYTEAISILFVTNRFPYEVRQYINNQIFALLKAGHIVHIFAHKAGTYSNNTQYAQYDLFSRIYYDVIPNHIRDFDIIYAQFGGSGVTCLRMLKKNIITGKLVVCFRGADATKHLHANPHLYDQLFKKADLLFVVCKHFKEILVSYGCLPEKIIVYHSGIDIDQFPYVPRKFPTCGPIKIISVGRLVPMKGHQILIEAIDIVRKQYPQILLTIIGDGWYRKNLETLIEQKQLQEYVVLQGYLPHTAVIAQVLDAHISILASITTADGEQEGIPNALMEAMATGMPVIGTYHSGIPELIIDGVSGLLVPENDAQALAEKIILLIENPEWWLSLGKSGAHYVTKEHNTERQNIRLMKHFKKLLEA